MENFHAFALKGGGYGGGYGGPRCGDWCHGGGSRCTAAGGTGGARWHYFTIQLSSHGDVGTCY